VAYPTDIRGYFLFLNWYSETCMQVNGASQSNGTKLSGWVVLAEAPLDGDVQG